MIGDAPTIKDITLDLEQLILPANLLCNETLPTEAELEDPVQDPYRVITNCDRCFARLRLFVVASESGIRTLQRLLFGDLRILCPRCSSSLQDGRAI